MTPDTNTPPPPDAADLDIVLTHPETARMLRLSIRSLDRLCEIGEAPPRIQLTGRRVGYWRSDVLAWLKARTFPAKRAT
ncbi:MAG: helix-turn-helix transcriptional regulator [Janthinobacterium lividum]